MRKILGLCLLSVLSFCAKAQDSTFSRAPFAGFSLQLVGYGLSTPQKLPSPYLVSSQSYMSASVLYSGALSKKKNLYFFAGLGLSVHSFTFNGKMVSSSHQLALAPLDSATQSNGTSVRAISAPIGIRNYLGTSAENVDVFLDVAIKPSYLTVRNSYIDVRTNEVYENELGDFNPLDLNIECNVGCSISSYNKKKARREPIATFSMGAGYYLGLNVQAKSIPYYSNANLRFIIG